MYLLFLHCGDWPSHPSRYPEPAYTWGKKKENQKQRTSNVSTFVELSLPFTIKLGFNWQSHQATRRTVMAPTSMTVFPSTAPLIHILLTLPSNITIYKLDSVKLWNWDQSFSTSHSYCSYLRLNRFCDRANLIHFQQETVTSFFLHSHFDA